MGGQPPAGEKFRWAVDFSIDGDLRFLSHRDVIRLFNRALARAALPVRMSQGFNPRPRFSLPLPRPVGVASQAERLVLEISEPISADALQSRLREQMPEGLIIRSVALLDAHERCRPEVVIYEIALMDGERENLSERVAGFLSSANVIVNREEPGQKTPRRVNVRPYVRRLDLTPEGMRVELYVSGQGSARPVEVCKALDLHDEGMNSRILRTEIQWN